MSRRSSLNGKMIFSFALLAICNLCRAEDAALPTQNAVLEGIQLSTQAGASADEKVVTGYFIFRDKPSSYFYETKIRDNTLIFEFHDAEKGAAPLPSVNEDPVLGFTVDQKKVDVNKEITGLNPEMHDVVTVTFKLRKIPVIAVNDEYNVISFSYKWPTNPANVDKYVVKEKNLMPWVWTGVGVGVVGVGVAIVAALPPPTAGPQPLNTGDLPDHNAKQ